MGKRNIYMLFFVLPVLSCKVKGQDFCDSQKFREIDFNSVHVKISIPTSSILMDTAIYSNGETILRNKFENHDTSFTLFIYINDYSGKLNRPMDPLERIALVQKEEVESAKNSKKLLKEEFKTIDSIKIGFLKYLVEQPDRKFYAGRIFFYREKKLIILWAFEKFTQKVKDDHSMIDCVFENIRLE